MAGMKNRTDGMIWIDQISPYRLKYHIHGEDYTVETAVTYKAEVSDHETCPVGTVVKLGSNDQIVPALFPIDLPNVLGVVLQTGKTSASSGTTEISIGKSGAIRIPQNDWSKVFVPRDVESGYSLTSPLIETLLDNMIDPNIRLAGAPVYWDCGYTTGANGIYISPLAGKLTLQTPSGFKYKIFEGPTNQSLSEGNGSNYATTNIGYNNLPQIGTISVMHYDGIHSEDGYLEINLNFGIFDSTIEWYWPAMSNVNTGLKISSSTTPNILDLYHGLFAPTAFTDETVNPSHEVVTTVRCPCQISARESNTNLDLDLIGNFTHHFANEGSYTELKYMIPEDLKHVYISGEVIYGFNKN